MLLTTILLGVPKISGTFAIIFIICSLENHIIAMLTGTFHLFQYPLTATNTSGQLSFQLPLSGPSEKLIFRAVAITMLALVVKGRLSYANLIAAIIFGLARVSFSLDPFDLSYSAYQVLLSIGLGIFYGDCYEKTGSIFHPMIMYSVSNVVMVSFTIIGPMLFVFISLI